MNTDLIHIQARWQVFILLLAGFILCWPVVGVLDARTLDREMGVLPENGVEARSLKLAGTVVNSVHSNSLAVIEDLTERRQRIFHEGDRVGAFIIQKIMHDQILVDAGTGPKKVKIRGFLSAGSGAAPDFEPSPGAAVPERIGSRDRSYVIDPEDVAAAFADTEMLDGFEVTPGRRFKRKTGIRITSITPGSIFTKMGLRSGDLILRVNDREISGPEEVSSLFKIFGEGGDVDLRVRRRARTYHIYLQIQ